MSVSLIKEQINRFLANDEPAVIAIKGQWGVGKTYSWNSFLKDAKKSNIIKFTRYSYVSLFGLASLDALKYAIFENAIPKSSIGEEPSLKTFQNNTKAVSEGVGRKALGLVKNIPYLKNASPVLESLTFLSLKEMVICIDDLERKGQGLSLKDVLGLVSLLKEQKKCKVVLLLNNGTNETKDYETYKEKVIDIEFSFKPTPQECAQIAYNGKAEFYANLKDLTSSVGITNIRVLKKIERLVNDIYPFTKETDDKILYSIMHSIVLYSWCYYCFIDDEFVPSLEFIENEQFMFYGAFNKEKDNDPKKLAWKDVLSKYKYYRTSDLDKILINAVRDGYYNENALKNEINNENVRILDGKSRDDFTIAWGLYHDSFDNNEAQVIDSLYHSFLENYKTIAPNNLDGLVCFLREFGEDEKASYIIDVYINGRSGEVELFDVTSSSLFNSLEDGELIDRFNSVYHANKLATIGTPSEILLRVSNNRGWNNEDVDCLCGISVEGYYNLFKTTRGEELYKIVKAALLFGEISGGGDKYKIIDNKVKWALTAISYEGEINKRRVRKFISTLD
ncbi:hypothetical protein RVX78_000060 [Enterobacter cloacae]|nr:hypothetical protein [Enterobacter cloacae]